MIRYLRFCGFNLYLYIYFPIYPMKVSLHYTSCNVLLKLFITKELSNCNYTINK